MGERVQAGQPAPDFDLMAPPGRKYKLSNLVGDRHLVLFFYPQDDTPGCTAEATGFRDRIREFRDLGAEVFGVSVDTLVSHESFSRKHSIPFPLLSDFNKLASGNYGVLSPQGKAERVTFLIGRDGIVKKVFDPVNEENHPEEVLRALRELN